MIPGLPESMQEVPNTRREWEAWRDRVLIYRTLIRGLIETDEQARADVLRLCSEDPAYEFCVFGVVFEPRDREVRGWLPMIPYHFQVKIVRFIQEVMSVKTGSPEWVKGRGDGVIEKARDMSGSWTVCGFYGNRWRHDHDFVGGLMSYAEHLVKAANATDTLFYKIEGYLGLDDRVQPFRAMTIAGREVQVPLRPPAWLIPDGFNPRHHLSGLTIANPANNNLIQGYSTTSRTGIGGRSSIMVPDEAAKFDKFRAVWDGLSAVSDHRLALSSADIRYGVGFRDLARFAEDACELGAAGPSFLRISSIEHPERDDLWREAIEARHADSDQGKAALAREYDIDYEAGSGLYLYPDAKRIVPMHLEFDPEFEDLDFCVDPGINDKTAIHLVKYNRRIDRYGVLASYVNNNLPADFYASLAVAMPVGEFSEKYGDTEYQFMEWFEDYGHLIRYWTGDPAGKKRDGGQATSFYGDFTKAVKRYTDNRRSIVIWSSNKSDYLHLVPRHNALRWMLAKMDFNDTFEVQRTLNAVREHRRRHMDDSKLTTARENPVVHGWGSDRVTALEFHAARLRLRNPSNSLGNMTQTGPIRYSMSGKRLS